jgi:hypothetical protein
MGGPEVRNDRLNATILRRRMQLGDVRENRVLQDAYINYHSELIPRHDFTVGQFKPPIGEEGNRNSGQLDFVERAMINQFSNQRDMGIQVHGAWLDGKFDYWIAGFNSPDSFHSTFASYNSRSDDNDAKDLAWKLRFRPLWQDETWGSLELGLSRQDGVHGESGKGLYITDTGVSTSVDGLSIQETHAYRMYGWAWYRPGGPVRGWWMRGEYGSFKDRLLPGRIGSFNLLVGSGYQPFQRDGFYLGTGYRLSESCWAEELQEGGWLAQMLYKMEPTFRYERFGNILTEGLQTDPSNLRGPVKTDVFKSDVYTLGLNLYWKGFNVRSQFNYLIVDEPDGHRAFVPAASVRDHRIREVDNNVLLLNTQIMF